MSDDSPISPLSPVRGERLEPVAPAVTPRVDAARRADATAQPNANRPIGEGELGDAAEREEIAHPARTPSGVASAALVHDAAQHGNRIAAAIESTRQPVASQRAQELAGAAASAGSGQAAQVDLEPGPVREEDDVDPLGRVAPIPKDPRHADQHPDDQATSH